MDHLVTQGRLLLLGQVSERLEAGGVLRDEGAALQEREGLLGEALVLPPLGDVLEELGAGDALERVLDLAGDVLREAGDVLAVVGGRLDAVFCGAGRSVSDGALGGSRVDLRLHGGRVRGGGFLTRHDGCGGVLKLYFTTRWSRSGTGREQHLHFYETCPIDGRRGR